MERELVVRAGLGDHDAFAELVERVASRCQSTAHQILRDEALAQDATQEALVRAWRDLPRLRDPDRFEAWLRRLLVHACYDAARRERRRRGTELKMTTELRGPMTNGAWADPAVGDGATALAERDALGQVLAGLSPAHRAALVLRHVLDLSVPQVAESLGVPIGTAKSRLHHAERALRTALEREQQAAVRGEQPT